MSCREEELLFQLNDRPAQVRELPQQRLFNMAFLIQPQRRVAFVVGEDLVNPPEGRLE